ncbi:uncharacterized protein LOC134700084 [Mytilus trossulus]|uniref:uncharacterized protein LOC134700084 n=1 Tax=Mytilus trossulus TaxID=6551 RepID=UPI003006BAEC
MKQHGNTALHFAARQRNTEIPMLLIDAGIDLNAQNTFNGDTALHDAVYHRNTEIVRLLIDGGVDLNIQNQDGHTALHIAAEKDDQAIASLLLDNDCDPNIRNKHGNKPSELAKGVKMKQLLKDYESCLPGLPIEVKKLDKNSAHIFSSLLGEESYLHFESRVMLAGEQGTGKTTIARHLVGKQPTRFRKSTDGIELYNGLSYFVRETKKWLGGQQDFSLEEITVCRSLSRADTTTQKQNVPSADTTPTSQHKSDVTEEASMSTNEEWLKHKSNESTSGDATLSTECSMTEAVKAKKLSKPQFQTVPGCANSLAISMEKKLPGHVAGQKSERVDNDDIYESDEQGVLRSSERQSVVFDFDGESSDTRNDLVVLDYATENQTLDVTKYREIHELSFDEYKPMADSLGASLKSGVTGDLHIETVTKPGIIAHLKRVFGITKQVKEVKVSITKESFLEKSSKVGKKKLHTRKIAPIIIWDFGGQDVFYSTHQTFLTYRAIYILVLDGSRKLDDPCPTEQYLPGKSGQKTAKDYLLFWINTIVTYCKGSVEGFPRITIVLTHKDKLKPNEIQQRRTEVFAEIKHMFSQTPFMQHLVIEDQIFVNAKDKCDPELAKLKKIIIRESKMQPTWGEPLPKCFIPLELEFASLIKRDIPLITMEHLQKINSLQPIRSLTESELKVFLKFQHAIGKVLYFDEHRLNRHVILSPTHLIDAFKSIVTDRSFCEGDKEREELWDVMGKKGVVSKQVIQQIWKKKKYRTFYNDKDYLLNVMTHLDILVEPRRYNSDHHRIPADFYYIASMVRAKDESGYLKSAGIANRSIAIAFQSSSLMIPPALSFRFISYCLYVWAVKTYGESKHDMLFHRSGVFTLDPSLDMSITCEDDMIIGRLVHARTNTLISRDMAHSIIACLTSALEKISQLYIRTSSDSSEISDAAFVTRICCNSPDNPCIIDVSQLENISNIWICPSHGIEHNINIITSWFQEKGDDKCEPDCPVTTEEFLKEIPSDLHLRRLSLLYNRDEIRQLAMHLGLTYAEWENVCDQESQSDEPEKLKFEILRKCRNKFSLTFKSIKDATENANIQNPHTICKVVSGANIDLDDKWDIVPTDEHIDRLAPLIGNSSLHFLIELDMKFETWEQICHIQADRDLVRLNKNILEEWRNQFCRAHNLKPTLRKIGQAFSNVGKHVKMVENTLSDLF